MKRCCWGFGGQLCAQLVPAPLVLRRLHREKLARLKVEAADFIRRARSMCDTTAAAISGGRHSLSAMTAT